MASFTLPTAAWQIALSVAVAAMGVFTFKLIKMRMIFYKLKNQGLVGRVSTLT